MRGSIVLLALFLSVFSFAQDTAQRVVPGRSNQLSQQEKPYVILISADGFRYDYIDKYEAPNLRRLSGKGVRAASMIPSYPSVTFPNHYTVATGMYPSHHGLVYNQYYDRSRNQTYNMGDRKAVEDGSWYGGVPLWVLAEQQGMLSASYHFVGTEAPVLGIYPTYWYKFNDNIDIDRRIATVVDWLQKPAAERPHFISFYFSNTDHAGHMFGPDANETKEAVAFVDASIGKLNEAVRKTGLPVNFVFVADHGMAAVDTAYRMDIGARVDTNQFVIRGGGTSLHLYAKDPSYIQPLYEKLKREVDQYQVYLKKDIPASWHYSTTDDRFNRIGDILVVPVYPKVLSSGTRRIVPGAHGFDPKIKEMHATFLAWGPAIKKGRKIPSFENVHVYPFICAMLGLTYTHEIDGRPEVLAPVLRKK